VKRNTIVLIAVSMILAAFAWAGWAHSRLEAVQLMASTAPTEAAAGAVEELPQSVAPLIGKPAPEFTLEDLNGKKVSLADFKGKAVLINFWATWCAPCRVETPWLIELRSRYAAQGLEVVGISLDDIHRGNAEKLSEEKRQIARFVQQMQIPYPVLIDGDTVSQPYGGLDALPASFYVDRNGTVVAAQVGVTTKDEMEADIRKALGVSK
jgi:cytochrome c biogenesis protein CcmG/thiol:disulfide interchange protein DsbE